MNSSIYNFVVRDITGKDYPLKQLEGQKTIIVNTASQCGLTPQYQGLQELYLKYNKQSFTIIGFPANNFMSQEPGSNPDIATFCTRNYGVSFPMMSKISVQGEDQHPLYQYLTQKELNGFQDSKVKWNFQKYLIDEKGQLSGIISPDVEPLSSVIINWIEEK